MLELNEKVRKLESELSGTYKEQQASTMQVLELTKKANDAELARKDLESKLQAAQDYNNQNATILAQKVGLDGITCV